MYIILFIRSVIFLKLESLSLYHKWLDSGHSQQNWQSHDADLSSSKLYARKNKCPRLCSALTYIDEEHPSRIDFGKHKFGGPFTDEEVEDVKTVHVLLVGHLLFSIWLLF